MIFGTDPLEQKITLKKELGIWPDPLNAAFGIIPYLQNMGNTTGLVLNCKRGETVYTILDNCPKVDTIYCFNYNLPDKEKSVLNGLTMENLQTFESRYKLVDPYNDKVPLDFIMVENVATPEEVKDILTRYHPFVKSRGIVAFHPYHTGEIQHGVKQWRNENNVRPLINVSKNFVWFWRLP